MKPTILTQKNVCAFLGLIMALTIVWSASAEAKVDNINEVLYMDTTTVHEVKKEEILQLEIDIERLVNLPTITFINKHGEVVAQFYGDKSTLKHQFRDSIERGQLITAVGNHEIYLL